MVQKQSPEIRPIAPTDASEISAIIESSRSVSLVDAQPIGPVWTREQINAECTGPGLSLRGDRGQVIAFLLYRDLGDAWEITFLATAPNARGQGVMSRLVKHFVATKPTNKALWLEVHEHNTRARRLYERNGFCEVGRRARYYSDGGAAVLYNYG